MYESDNYTIETVSLVSGKASEILSLPCYFPAICLFEYSGIPKNLKSFLATDARFALIL